MRPKILVSNRSEIACRIFQACREMGIPSVGVVAPGDEDSRHVTYADEIWPISSYLDIPSLVHAATKSGSTLVHPGYGFLSERPAFARAVEAAGLVFIGPRPETMELMGGKIAAKELAAKNGVPTLPWAKVGQGSDLVSVAATVGYPLLLKASAGGGGKGMRRVERVEDLVALAESASAEAQSAFGDGTLFLEKWVEQPRHIEVQVFGDGEGGGVHLHERECSIQRRHQKIWEEATAPNLSDKTKDKLFQAALSLVRATHYRNAGTIEFLVDSSENYYFLEMNTRLQVEHPVTEQVTGVDLVWAQILQAQSPGQAILSEAPGVRGHAIEVRIYAEDPSQGFIPTPGRVEKLKWPTGAGIRIESGIEEGQMVGTQFDSMLGKMIVSAQTREQTLKRLKFALEETVILGVGTNQNYLCELVQHPHVVAGKVTTHFLTKEFSAFSPQPSQADLEIWMAAQSQGWGRSLMGSAGPEDQKFPSPWQSASVK